MKLLALMPYKQKLLRALNEAIQLNLCSITLIGDKNHLIEKCFKENIDSQQFVIYDIVNDVEAVDFCKEMLASNKADFVIFGDVPSYYQTKVMGVKDNNEVGEIDIIDLPFLRHFLFISSNSKYLTLDFEDKKRSIIQAETFMKSLDIKKANVALVSNMNAKTDILETNIIKMILKENDYNNIKIYDSFSIALLFSRISAVNIYNTNINLLIMRNYESAKIFVDTLSVFTNAKIANILSSQYLYAIDSDSQKDSQSILFSIMILNKIAKNSKTICYTKKYVI